MLHEDDYLPCDAYKNQEAHPKVTGFTSFFDEKSAKYFFAYVSETGKVLLKSEGYPDEKPRETGIKSVIKNLLDNSKYAIKSEDGRYFLSLKAGNNKEIARSCDFATEAEAWAVLTEITGESSEISIPISTFSEEKYLPSEAYLGYETLWNEYGKTGYAKFTHENSKYYFVVYNPDGSIYLSSEGFDSEEIRDAELQKVEQNILLEDNYKINNEGGAYFVALTDASGKSLARSTNFDSFTAALLTTPAGREKAITDGIF